MIRLGTLGAAVVAMCIAGLGVGASPEFDSAVVSGKSDAKAVGVIDAKASVSDGQKIVLQGRVKDFVDDQAVVTVTDTSLKSCKETGDNCPTPWDFCCHSKVEITSNSATVKLVGASGKQAVKGGLKGVKGINHLTLLSAEGTAQKDKRGNLVILASRIYVTK